MSRHRAVRNLDLDGVHIDWRRSYSKLNAVRSRADELDDSPLDEGHDADYRETQTVKTCAIQNAHTILLLLPVRACMSSWNHSRAARRVLDARCVTAEDTKKADIRNYRANGSWPCERSRSAWLSFWRFRQGDQGLAMVLLLR